MWYTTHAPEMYTIAQHTSSMEEQAMTAEDLFRDITACQTLVNTSGYYN